MKSVIERLKEVEGYLNEGMQKPYWDDQHVYLAQARVTLARAIKELEEVQAREGRTRKAAFTEKKRLNKLNEVGLIDEWGNELKPPGFRQALGRPGALDTPRSPSVATFGGRVDACLRQAARS